jgi:hypothetical protein
MPAGRVLPYRAVVEALADDPAVATASSPASKSPLPWKPKPRGARRRRHDSEAILLESEQQDWIRSRTRLRGPSVKLSDEQRQVLRRVFDSIEGGPSKNVPDLFTPLQSFGIGAHKLDAILQLAGPTVSFDGFCALLLRDATRASKDSSKDSAHRPDGPSALEAILTATTEPQTFPFSLAVNSSTIHRLINDLVLPALPRPPERTDARTKQPSAQPSALRTTTGEQRQPSALRTTTGEQRLRPQPSESGGEASGSAAASSAGASPDLTEAVDEERLPPMRAPPPPIVPPPIESSQVKSGVRAPPPPILPPPDPPPAHQRAGEACPSPTLAHMGKHLRRTSISVLPSPSLSSPRDAEIAKEKTIHSGTVQSVAELAMWLSMQVRPRLT